MPEEVTVVRKNARMHITVRGLDDGVPEERYYFTVQAPNDGYDFNGKPMAGTATVRRAGTFGPNGDFATVGTFNMIHTDTPDDAETGVGVSLYERMTVRSQIGWSRRLRPMMTGCPFRCLPDRRSIC